MSRVISWIGDAAENVWNGIADIGEAAWDTVDAIGHTIDDEVLQPVANIAKAIGKGFEDDPLGTIAKIATAFIAPEYLPLVVGADAMAQGAQFKDALKMAATVYITQKAIPIIQKYVQEGLEGLGTTVEESETFFDNTGSAYTLDQATGTWTQSASLTAAAAAITKATAAAIPAIVTGKSVQQIGRAHV